MQDIKRLYTEWIVSGLVSDPRYNILEMFVNWCGQPDKNCNQTWQKVIIGNLFANDRTRLKICLKLASDNTRT